MRWFHRLMCRWKMHSYEFVPLCSAEELDRRVKAAQTEFEAVCLVLDNLSGSKWRCVHCNHRRDVI